MVPKGKELAFSENKSKFVTKLIEGYFIEVSMNTEEQDIEMCVHSFIKKIKSFFNVSNSHLKSTIQKSTIQTLEL